jgi:cobalt-zinc-cadmium efflux system membrane fusion protein
LPITAPVAGLLRNLSALPGQSVPAGAALFEVADFDKVWVRVPVYVGDQDDIDPKRDVAVGALTAKPGDKMHAAKRTAAPPTANSAAGTVDLYFELDNRTPSFSPGHRVSVAVSLKGEAEYLVVPWESVVHDIYGGTWIYERTSDLTFTRRRVVVRWVADKEAVLAFGPAPGTRVVTAGAAELFGTEVGFTK